jgi:transporter family protein
MPNYILFSLLAAFSFALSSIANKFASKHAIKDKWTILFYYYLTFLPFIFIIPFITKIQIPTNSWKFLFSFSLLFFLGNYCFFTAIFKTDASVFAPFFQLQSAFVAILAFLFLGERFPLGNYIWIGLVLLGGVLVSLDERMNIGTFMQKNILLIILMQVFHSMSNLAAGFALENINPLNLIFWTTLISNVLVLIIIPAVAGFNLKASFNQLKPMFSANFFAFIGATSLFTAFQTNLTISSALSLLTAPIVLALTIAASRFKPDLLEHHTRKVYFIRTIGVLIIMLSAFKLSTG